LPEGDNLNGNIPDEGAERLKSLLNDEKRRGEEYLTRLKYLQADFENYRKRTDKELRDREESALRGLVETLLSALDELELAIDHAQRAGEKGELLDGLRMVHRKIATALGTAGLTRIECVGKPFDPSMHEAVEKVQGTAEGADVVSEETRPGYMFRGKMLRPSMVKVELGLREQGGQEAAKSE